MNFYAFYVIENMNRNMENRRCSPREVARGGLCVRIACVDGRPVYCSCVGASLHASFDTLHTFARSDRKDFPCLDNVLPSYFRTRARKPPHVFPVVWSMFMPGATNPLHRTQRNQQRQLRDSTTAHRCGRRHCPHWGYLRPCRSSCSSSIGTSCHIYGIST